MSHHHDDNDASIGEHLLEAVPMAYFITSDALQFGAIWLVVLVACIAFGAPAFATWWFLGGIALLILCIAAAASERKHKRRERDLRDGRTRP